MADLQPGAHIKDRHDDLRIQHDEKEVLSWKNVIKGLKVQREKIMEVDIANIDFDIACHVRLIEEMNNRILELKKNKKNKGEIIDV